jgi:Glycoside-hydrolase family GH114
LGLGLKNGIDILHLVRSQVNFAVNEECVLMNECEKYNNFVNLDRKQVFHIEYPVRTPQNLTEVERYRWCAQSNLVSRNGNFSTVLKVKSLDGWVQFCDGSLFSTPTINDGPKSSGNRFGGWFGKTSQPRPGNPTQNNANNNTQLLGSSSPPRLTTTPVGDIEMGVAKRDGYPFPPGQGSESIIPDSILDMF